MSSSSDAPTIIELKLSFLRGQILLLSQRLRPSGTSLRRASDDEVELRQKAIDDALQKLDGLLRRHNRLSYGPQAQRHVAEQIDRLYWEAGERGGGWQGGMGEEWAERGADLRKETLIEKLPEEWSEEAETKAPAEAARYKELQRKLVELNEKRRAAREKLERYRAMKKLLEPFEADAGVQGNLVTRNGEMEKELERMRMLMLRVERGIMGLEKRGEGEGEEMDIDVDVDEQGKVLALLGGR